MALAAAACMDDDLKHTPLLAQILKVATTIGTGLLVGMAIGAAAVFIVGTGGAGAVVLGAVVGAALNVAVDIAAEKLTGKDLLTSINDYIGSAIDAILPGVPKGKVVTASSNVSINSKKAARAAGKVAASAPPPPPKTIWDSIAEWAVSLISSVQPAEEGFAPVDEDKVMCSDHPPAPDQYIAQGSRSVFINGQPAARAGDKSTCDGVLSVAPGRKGNVGIGGETVQVRAITSEMPAWLAAVSRYAGYALAVCQAIRGKGPLVEKLICLGTNMAIGMAADIAVKGTVAVALSGKKGNPVHLPTGNKILNGEEDFDFTVPALLPIEGQRYYNAANFECGMFGQGWSTLWDTALYLNRPDILQENDPNAIHALLDEQGRWIPLPAVAPGEKFALAQEGMVFAQLESGSYCLMYDDGLLLDFGPDNGQHKLCLQGLETPNLYRHFLHRDDCGRLLSITSSCGQVVRFDYSDPSVGPISAHLYTAEAPEQSHLLVSYRYTEQGQLKEVLNPLSETCRVFAYNQRGLMNHQRLPSGQTVDYQWSLYSIKPDVGMVTDQNSGMHWRVSGWQTNQGDSVQVKYHNGGAHTVSTAPDMEDRHERWSWDDKRRVTSYVDAMGEETKISWHSELRLIEQITLPSGGKISFKYDEHCNLVSMKDPLERETRTEWHHLFALPLRRSYPDKSRHEWEYDDAGNLGCEYFRPADPKAKSLVERWAYDEKGQLYAHTDAEGGLRYYHHDRHGLLIRHTDCSGKTTRYHYNALGDLLRERNAEGHQTHFEHNAAGQLCRVDLPDGATHRWHWQFGRLDAYRDAEGNKRSYGYTASGLPKVEIDGLGYRQTSHYNGFGEMVELTDFGGQSTHFVYDASGQLIEQTNCDGLVTRYRLDANGLPIEVLQAAGLPEKRLIQLRRNIIGQLQQKIQGPYTTEYHYDLLGKLISAQRSIHLLPESELCVVDECLLTYDQYGNLASETTVIHALLSEAFDGNVKGAQLRYTTLPKPRKQTLQHRYDNLGNRIATILPDGKTINTLRYGSGHIHQINVDGVLVSDIERDNLHRTVTYSAGKLIHSRRLDPLGRTQFSRLHHPEQKFSTIDLHPPEGFNGKERVPLDSVSDRYGNPTPEDVILKGYRYSKNGELNCRRDAILGEQAYQYDANGRITQSHSVASTIRIPSYFSADAYLKLAMPSPRSKYPEFDERFYWDASSNPLERPLPNQKLSVVGGNRLHVFEDQRFTHDIFGRLIKKYSGKAQSAAEVRLNLSWDDEDHLINSERHAQGSQTNCSYHYDLLGRRIAKQSGETTTWFLWDGMQLLQEERRARQIKTYALKTWFYHDDGYEPIACWDTESDGEEPITFRSDEVYHFHNHINGAPEELSNHTGQIIWRARYRTWGNTVLMEWEKENYTHEEKVRHYQKTQNLRFQGQYFDEETGLHYNTFRYYDPGIGRFVSQDPIGLAGGLNLYQYAPNPISWIDPWGWNWNYILTDSKGNDYYHGRASDSQTIDDIKRRHSNTIGSDGSRFGNGDRITQITPHGTPYDTVRGIEQMGISENKLLGKGNSKVRGNKINGISEKKQLTNKGKRRLSSAAKFLQSKGVSKVSALKSTKTGATGGKC